jgi:hypothetical protein
MVFGYFTLFVALMISAVAEFYSIVGLTAIFSAAFWPIVIMGACLGVGKVTAAVWLKLNWERANWTYKLYLVPAVAFLMLLTSMGIFGFLSKAHSDQSMVSGDSMAKVAIYDEKIKISKDNIDANRKALKQMDEAVDQVMGRSSDEKGAEKAVGIRRSQQKERVRLQSEIQAEQKTIAALSEERAPLAAEFRKVEAEVGPIKYIAALVYEDNPDANVLEKAVRLVIILIVAVFDPLALVLILAAQQSLRWAQEEKDAPKYKPDDGPLTDDQVAQLKETVESFKEEPELSFLDKHPYLLKPFHHFENLKPMVYKPELQPESQPEPLPQEVVHEPVPPSVGESDAVQEAMSKWKEANPDNTLKRQRSLLDTGKITELPWMQLVEDNKLPESTNSGFGISFPNSPKKGDKFVRVDRLPSVVYKFNGNDWIEVDKNLSDSYTYDVAYIDHLIDRIETGEYDIDLLSESERDQVAQRLLNKAT